jgi:hypothetical protein
MKQRKIRVCSEFHDLLKLKQKEFKYPFLTTMSRDIIDISLNGKNRRKRGEIGQDILTYSIIIVFIILLFFFGCYVFDKFNNSFQSNDSIPDNAKVLSQEINNKLPRTLDYAIVLFFILLWIAGLLTAYLIPADSPFFIISILMSIIVFVYVPALMLIIKAFADNATIGPTVHLFTNTLWLSEHFLMLLIMLFISFGFVLYGKSRN